MNMGTHDKRRLALTGWTMAGWMTTALDGAVSRLARAFAALARKTAGWKIHARARREAARGSGDDA
jgi:hypothetical protein